MKRYISIILSIFMISCGSHKYYNEYYRSSEGQKDRAQVFYVVDTIKIANPIMVREKGDLFVLSQSAFEKSPTKKIKDLYRETDVYMVGMEFFFYNYLSPKDKARFYSSPIRYYNEPDEKTIIDGKECYKFKSPDVSFILGLIKVGFYNAYMINSCGEWYEIKNREYMNSYYRIVFPVLENTECAKVID